MDAQSLTHCRRFLLIDDEPVDREILSDCLRAELVDVELSEASTDDEALEKLHEEKFDCVLLDYHLPGRSADYLLSKIDGLYGEAREFPIIIVTGQGSEKIAISVFRAGASDYLSKDEFLTQPEKTAASIESAITSFRSQAEIRKQASAVQSEKIALLHQTKTLQRDKSSAEAANLSKSVFLADVSHEIRSPLTAIIGFTDLMLTDDISDADRKLYLESIKRSGTHLLAVINDILDLSKVEAGKIEIRKSRFDLLEVVEDVLSSFSALAASKGLQLKTFFPTEAVVMVVSDRTRVRQVITNLVSNAIKFTVKGDVSIIVHPEPHATTAGKVAVLVSDSGQGIERSEQSKLFKRFSQTSTATKSSSEGTGIGLVLSKKLARLLDGDLELISSIVGIGSVFRLTFPMCASLDATPDAHATPAPVTAIHLKGVRILVADDSADNRLLIDRFLRRFSAELVFANDGLELLQAARASSFDLIISDIQMPNVDGFEALKLLRAEGMKTPAIALTAYALPEDIEKARQAGFNLQVSKPIDFENLLGAITSLVSSSATQLLT